MKESIFVKAARRNDERMVIGELAGFALAESLASRRGGGRNTRGSTRRKPGEGEVAAETLDEERR